MNDVTSVNAIPDGSNVAEGFGPISYTDTFRFPHPLDDTLDQIVTDIFTVPGWVNGLMRIRNTIVRPFGLKTDDKTGSNSALHYDVGSQAIYFTVLKRTENEIILEEKDTHLNFRMSVLSDHERSTVSLTTIIYFNNFFGRVYFFFVKPFHKMIVTAILKRALKIRQKRRDT